MSEKVLIFSASPRKHGNSDLLCDRFLEGARGTGHQVEKISLRDKKINFCVACDGCKRNGGVCVQKDDMAEIWKNSWQPMSLSWRPPYIITPWMRR